MHCHYVNNFNSGADNWSPDKTHRSKTNNILDLNEKVKNVKQSNNDNLPENK